MTASILLYYFLDILRLVILRLVKFWEIVVGFKTMMRSLFEIGTYLKFWWKMQCFIDGGDYWVITGCITLHKIWQNTSLLWPIFSQIGQRRSSFYTENTSQKNPYSGIFYTVLFNGIYFCVFRVLEWCTITSNWSFCWPRYIQTRAWLQKRNTPASKEC